jgi:FkbM family methyltransferase
MITATIVANGRPILISGTHPAYLETLDGLQVASTALAAVITSLPKGALCFDVGANIGLSAITIALLRPDCRIVAFEPIPASVQCIHQNLSANRIQNVTVVEVAVTDHSKPVRMAENGPWSVLGQGELVCASARLDDYPFGDPAFIKIDVEGSEPNVLAGATRCLSRQPPVFMEFNTWTLLLQHYDPIAFADALIAYTDIVGMWDSDYKSGPIPTTGADLVHTNLIQHRSVSDILFRPRMPLPSLKAMTEHRH